jgi:hypothetical protein
MLSERRTNIALKPMPEGKLYRRIIEENVARNIIINNMRNYMTDLESGTARCGGSSPPFRTIYRNGLDAKCLLLSFTYHSDAVGSLEGL